jgi:hypothetical protein
MTVQTQRVLRQAIAILPTSSDELMLRGIAAETTDRIVALKKSEKRLQGKYDTLDNLEQQIKSAGVSPDDHTLYNDLLEWRAIRHELTALFNLLETL